MVKTCVKDTYNVYPNYCRLLSGVTQHSDILLKSSILTNESSIGSLDIIKHR